MKERQKAIDQKKGEKDEKKRVISGTDRGIRVTELYRPSPQA